MIKSNIESKIDSHIGRSLMARVKGDTNYSIREERLIAQKSVLEAKVKTLKEELKVKDVRLRELRDKVGKSNA